MLGHRRASYIWWRGLPICIELILAINHESRFPIVKACHNINFVFKIFLIHVRDMPLKRKFFHQILEWILFFLNLWVHLGHLFFVLSGSNGDYFFGLWLFLINYACGIDRHLPWFLFIRINNAWAPVNDIKEHFGVFWFWLRLLAFFTFSFLSPVHRFAFFIYFLLYFVKCYEIWYFHINFLI
jgi:hypothetical protein